jgi:cobalt-precorrin-5B (C1)-methyltransferase
MAAGVVKDAGDDPDVTDGAMVTAAVSWLEDGDVEFAAGKGVGTVTKEGLSVPPGEPAINPGPRAMIRAALREVTDRPVRITVSIAGGEALAGKTYNPRLGIEGGLSVLGTTGRVRPFSCKALQCSVSCEMDVARAAGVLAPVLVPGNIGERSARKHLALTTEQVIEVGNEWGYSLARIPRYPFRKILIWGHPGKIAKLARGQWDTHSSRSGPALDIVRETASDLGLWTLDLASHTTTEGLFAALDIDARERLANEVSRAVARACVEKAGGGIAVFVVLVNMAGEMLGAYGDMEEGPWKKREK